MFYITFLRHAESTGNAEEKLQGRSSTPLSDLGENQAAELAKYWKQKQITYNRIISSPLARARQTGEIIAKILNLPIEFDPIWEERNFGQLEGTGYTDISLIDLSSEIFHPYKPVGETGESLTEIYLRAATAVQNLIRQPSGKILVVSHGAILNMVLYAILGINPLNFANGPHFYLNNTAYVNMIYYPDRQIWRMIGFHNHQLIDDW
jgi:broad specificity phosphatase PhoE